MPLFVYELNTWVWLNTLSRRENRRVMLDSVPEAEWDRLGSLGMDAVWLMGVWERSPEGRRIAIEEAGLEAEYAAALCDYSALDIPGSPYSVHRYRVEELLGGPDGLAAARRELAKRGLQLVLDFVPNHVAPDHEWVSDSPECFISSEKPGVVAHGKDPYFAPWTDTAQLNAFSPELRRRATETVKEIARQCDGVRCDMAMLLLNDVFQKTWGTRAGRRPETEYWGEVIPGVRAAYPEFLFIAEAYWDLEYRLYGIGFDYCYDKRLYERLVGGDARSLRAHLSADVDWQKKLIRFLENHDEPRAAAVMPPERHRAAAVVLSTVPGSKLFFAGQFSGHRVKLPVQLGRAPDEPDNRALEAFYASLMAPSRELPFEFGTWILRECSGWPDNQSCRNLLAWTWNDAWLIVVNFAAQWSQGYVWEALAPKAQWRLENVLSPGSYERPGDEPLYVELPPWGYYFWRLTRV